MQLGLPTDVVVPAGAGALALLIAFVVVLTRGRTGRTEAGPHDEPTAADWTGEAATGTPCSYRRPRPGR